MKPATHTHPRASTPAQPAGHPHQPEDAARDLPGTATAPGYTGIFCGRAEEAARVRRELAAYLGAGTTADDVILIADELAANAILHTRSQGASFTVRCHTSPGLVRIEIEDLGGPWRQRPAPADRPHGLDVIAALTGPDGWGTQITSAGGRVVWARLPW